MIILLTRLSKINDNNKETIAMTVSQRRLKTFINKCLDIVKDKKGIYELSCISISREHPFLEHPFLSMHPRLKKFLKEKGFIIDDNKNIIEIK